MKGIAITIGKGPEDTEMDEGSMLAKDFASAVKKGDPQAILEAFKALNYYCSQEEDSLEEE
jgi:hypothetical protein